VPIYRDKEAPRE